jgi:hypothetical protein
VPFPNGALTNLAQLCDWIERTLHVRLPFDTETWTRLSGSLLGSNEKLREQCDWTPPYSLREGLRLTLGSGTA